MTFKKLVGTGCTIGDGQKLSVQTLPILDPSLHMSGNIPEKVIFFLRINPRSKQNPPESCERMQSIHLYPCMGFCSHIGRPNSSLKFPNNLVGQFDHFKLVYDNLEMICRDNTC